MSKKKKGCFVCSSRKMLTVICGKKYCEPCGMAKLDFHLRNLDYRLFRATKAWEKERNEKGLTMRELILRRKVEVHFKRVLGN